MIQAVLFDFDGVLTTDATGSLSTCRALSEMSRLPFDRVNTAYRKHNHALLCGKMTHADMWPEFCADLGEDVDFSLLQKAFLATPLDAQMLRLAQGLRAAGYRIGMVTDNKSDRLRSLRAHYSWDALFDVIAVSADIGSGKEERAIFDFALQALSLLPEGCVFIDNTEKNLIMPRKMGLKTIYFDHEKRDFALLRSELQQYCANLPEEEET